MGDVLTHVDRAAGQPVPWAGELVSGPRTGRLRYPGGPVDRELERGDTVLMDLSVRVRGYWAGLHERDSAVEAEPTADQARFFRAARNAFEAAVASSDRGAWRATRTRRPSRRSPPTASSPPITRDTRSV